MADGAGAPPAVTPLRFLGDPDAAACEGDLCPMPTTAGTAPYAVGADNPPGGGPAGDNNGGALSDG
ncbi:hypothetical protein [Nocardiopsis ansamitocini]|uniref:Uncharacterized protein n=1 Tax=Nocardiopsis ansamitocini TaxID=1670832 RepID=A0A9W6UL05_9ACTN|nr:hypothetical protein [Nocardiopsis ansamitocini]GLU50252.1 hypothetical protein Nans01_46030 [Nocardiopsis ansamitocini]